MESKRSQLKKVSNMQVAQEEAYKIYGEDAKLYISNRKNKKYMIYSPIDDKFVHFGDIRYEDFTFHKDEARRQLYHKRHPSRGKWGRNPYSPHNLSLSILW